MSQRGIAATLTLIAILMVAGIVHIVSLLLVPRVASDDAYMRLSPVTPLGVVRTLPRAGSPHDPLPDRDPSVATAICRYDLSDGPLRVSAALGEGNFVALALHARSGVTFYGLDDRAGNDGKLDFVVMTAAQRDLAETRDSVDSPMRDVRVIAPEHQGFVSFDVLPRVGGYASALRGLVSVSCRVEHPV